MTRLKTVAREISRVIGSSSYRYQLAIKLIRPQDTFSSLASLNPPKYACIADYKYLDSSFTPCLTQPPVPQAHAAIAYN